jgi:hypothetical protein
VIVSRAPVLVKIDFRWSWIVCSVTDIRRAMARVSLPVASSRSSSSSRAVRPKARANRSSRSVAEARDQKVVVERQHDRPQPVPVRGSRLDECPRLARAKGNRERWGDVSYELRGSAIEPFPRFLAPQVEKGPTAELVRVGKQPHVGVEVDHVAEDIKVALIRALGFALGFALGWHPRGNPIWVGMLFVLGTLAFGGLGLLVAGTLRAEVTLAAANLIWLVLLFAGGIAIPLDMYPTIFADVARNLPSAVLSDGLRGVLQNGDDLPVREALTLLGWAVVSLPAAAMVLVGVSQLQRALLQLCRGHRVGGRVCVGRECGLGLGVEHDRVVQPVSGGRDPGIDVSLVCVV